MWEAQHNLKPCFKRNHQTKQNSQLTTIPQFRTHSKKKTNVIKTPPWILTLSPEWTIQLKMADTVQAVKKQLKAQKLRMEYRLRTIPKIIPVSIGIATNPPPPTMVQLSQLKNSKSQILRARHLWWFFKELKESSWLNISAYTFFLYILSNLTEAEKYMSKINRLDSSCIFLNTNPSGAINLDRHVRRNRNPV